MDPLVRASSVGVYRLWRDSGYAFGALLSGMAAHALGQNAAIALVAALTLASGAVVAVRMRETHPRAITPSPQGTPAWSSAKSSARKPAAHRTSSVEAARAAPRSSILSSRSLTTWRSGALRHAHRSRRLDPRPCRSRSGERELAGRTGALLHLHASADVAYPFTPLEDGSEISLGNVVARVLHTPGHTPESISLLVTDRTRADEPWMVLTGDTLFVGDVGRPDFGGESAGHALYASLQRLMALPDHVEVYPAHISGSPCGRAMSGKPSSTIGFERRHNTALRHPGGDAFVAALFEGLPSKPPTFAETIAANRAG